MCPYIVVLSHTAYLKPAVMIVRAHLRASVCHKSSSDHTFPPLVQNSRSRSRKCSPKNSRRLDSTSGYHQSALLSRGAAKERRHNTTSRCTSRLATARWRGGCTAKFPRADAGSEVEVNHLHIHDAWAVDGEVRQGRNDGQRDQHYGSIRVVEVEIVGHVGQRSAHPKGTDDNCEDVVREIRQWLKLLRRGHLARSLPGLVVGTSVRVRRYRCSEPAAMPRARRRVQRVYVCMCMPARARAPSTREAAICRILAIKGTLSTRP